jgi:hypothetical protein
VIVDEIREALEKEAPDLSGELLDEIAWRSWLRSVEDFAPAPMVVVGHEYGRPE